MNTTTPTNPDHPRAPSRLNRMSASPCTQRNQEFTDEQIPLLKRGLQTLVPVLAVFLAALMPGLCTQVAQGSQERIVDPDEVTQVADTGESFGRVRVTVTAHTRDNKRQISGIRLQVKGKTVVVPGSAFADLSSPWLNSLEIRTEPGFDDGPWLYVFLKTGLSGPDSEGPSTNVRFVYHRGQIRSRILEITGSDGKITHRRDLLDAREQPDSRTTTEARSGDRESGSRLGTVTAGKYAGSVMFQYPEDDGEFFRVDVAISKPNDTAPIDSGRIDVWLLSKGGYAVRAHRRPRPGALIETSSAGSTASAIFQFRRSVQRQDLVAVVVSIDDELTVHRIPAWTGKDFPQMRTGDFVEVVMPYTVTGRQILDSRHQYFGPDASALEYNGKKYWISRLGLGDGVPYTIVGLYAPTKEGNYYRCLTAESWAAGNLQAAVSDTGVLELREHANSSLKGRIILSCNLKSIGTQDSASGN